jgi:hypothetical protein
LKIWGDSDLNKKKLSASDQKTFSNLAEIILTPVSDEFHSYIEILPDKIQRVVILEELYKEYNGAVNKLFGKKGANYFNESLIKHRNSYVELISESNGTYSFERIRSYLQTKVDEDLDSIFDNLLIPMKNLNDTIESFLGKKQKLKKREEIMTNLEEKYLEKIEFIKKFFTEVD